MERLTVAVFVVLCVLLSASLGPAQQKSMPARAKYDLIEVSEVTYELGQDSGGKVPVAWKVDVSNTDFKDHTVDVQVRFLDVKSGELFHDSVMRNRIPAKGTLTVSNTTMADAGKAKSIQSTQTVIRPRR